MKVFFMDFVRDDVVFLEKKKKERKNVLLIIEYLVFWKVKVIIIFVFCVFVGYWE